MYKRNTYIMCVQNSNPHSISFFLCKKQGRNKKETSLNNNIIINVNTSYYTVTKTKTTANATTEGKIA